MQQNDEGVASIGQVFVCGNADPWPKPRQWMTITGQGRCFIAGGVGFGAILMPCPLEGLDLDAIPDDLTQWNPASKDRPITLGQLWGEMQALRAEVAELRAAVTNPAPSRQ